METTATQEDRQAENPETKAEKTAAENSEPANQTPRQDGCRIEGHSGYGCACTPPRARRY